MAKETSRIISIDQEDVRRLPEGSRNTFLHFVRNNGGTVTDKRAVVPWDRDQMVRLLQERGRWVSEVFKFGLLPPFRNRMAFEASGYSDLAIFLEGLELVQCTFSGEHLHTKRGVLSDLHFQNSCLAMECSEARDCTFKEHLELRATASTFDGLGARRVNGLIHLTACTLKRVEFSSCRLDGLFEGCIFEGCMFYSLRGFQGPLRFESCRFDTCRFFNTFPEEIEMSSCNLIRCRGHLDSPRSGKVVASRHAERSADDPSAGDPTSGGGDLFEGVGPADPPDPGRAFLGD